MDKIIITDTETASIKGGIIDFAGIVIDRNLDEVSRFESLIDPCRPIAPAAQEVHGISADMVADQPTMAEYLELYGNPYAVQPGEDLLIIAHNAQFDCRVLSEEKLLPQTYKKCCTLRMARNHFTDLDPDEANHKLGTLAIMLGLERGPAHRAMGDVITCLNFLRKMADLSQASSIDDLLDLGMRALSLDSKMTTGKHKGMRLRDLPLSYVDWVVNKSEMDPDLKEALKPRLQRA